MILQKNVPFEVDELYPESDGKPLAQNSLQLRWIFVFYSNLYSLYASRSDVDVGSDLLWYPLEFHKISQAPDGYVVFGRPKRHRSSYLQWKEDNVPMTVVFEILSPGNTVTEMAEKFDFYETYGAEEYYIYDPTTDHLEAYHRSNNRLIPVPTKPSCVSPRLGIRFDLSGPEMVVYKPNGQRFLSFEELEQARQVAEQRADDAEQRAGDAEQRADDANKIADDERKRADDANKIADDERKRADDERKRADDERKRADDERKRADDERKRADRLILLGRKVRQGIASPDEIAELDTLESQPSGSS